ncbi:extracellular solute-binding protein [Vineibacter terrae]|uniref:extracellular solute-binding protein n=1 Tax=Vineibacter terrae TaxID=2586908 RepID=UPI001C49845F|nr:extracellular solute-binding protein [Vineibacter terrae]
MRLERRLGPALIVAAIAAAAFVWATPFLWTLVASLRPESAGSVDMASLWPDFAPTLANFRLALESGDFGLYYINTAIVVVGILGVQVVTISLAGYAFARLQFTGRDVLFYVFLLQLMLVPPALIVPNLRTIVDLGLYDTLAGVMAPYFASAFGTFLMRQTFLGIPRDFEEAAAIDGAPWWAIVWHVLLPLARPGLVAFAIVSVTAQWNEFLWPLMVINDPASHTLTIGLATFTKGAEGAREWGVLAAGTLLVMAPLAVAFGLDTANPPRTWAELVDAAKKLTKRDGEKIERHGFMMPGNYDTLGWLMSALSMSNGGRYFNESYGGEVYYDTPSMVGAARLVEDLVHKHKVMPAGVVDSGAVSTAFFAGKASMILQSTGSLSFIRENMKSAYSVAFVPRKVRNAVPIGGASLVMFKGQSEASQEAGWKFIRWLSSTEVLAGWSRFIGYFAPRKSAYDMPEMKAFIARHPDAKVALDQLAYAQPWFATYQTVAVRKALEDEMQAVLNGKKKADQAVKDAQRKADELLRPYVEQTALKLP